MTSEGHSPSSRPDSPAAHALARALAQPVLFGVPNRAALLACSLPPGRRRIVVGVHRNHAVEPVASACAPYAAWNDIACEWHVGDYDDSLSVVDVPQADVHLVWLDASRIALAEDELARWLGTRLQALRARTLSPIVVAAWPLAVSQRERIDTLRLPDVHLADLEPLALELGARWTDARTATLSGTSLSNQACLRVARELACRWLPAATLPPVKCIAVDLDGTLYDGVLGEDGAEGVRLDEGHVALQEELVRQRRAGVLLALVSRNQRADAQALFSRRHDFPLRWDDFSAVEVSWDDKSAGIERTAGQLRISTDACVFIDDNPGELAAVASRVPLATVHARADGGETLAALRHVAGIHRWTRSASDALRANDLRAAHARATAQAMAVSQDDYLRSLEARLSFYVGSRTHLTRMAELARKTNQWNLALRRMGEAEMAQRIAMHPGNAVAFALSDKLSDSGVVGAVVGRVENRTLHVDEVSISCRALGRSTEDVMITVALRLMARGRDVDRVRLAVVKGPRNAPARDWLARYAGTALADSVTHVDLPMAAINGRVLPEAIAVTVDPGDRAA